MRRLRLFSCVTVLLISLPVLADGPATGWTLSALESLAQEASPNLRQAAAEIGVTRGRRLQAGLYPNPELLTGAQQLGGSDSQYIAYLSQEIVTRGKLKLDKAAVHQEVTQAELRFVRTRFDLLTAVRQAFYTALAAQSRVDALQQLLELTRKSASAAEKSQKAGEGSESDTLLLQIEVDRAEVALENATALYDAALKQLSATLGDPDLVIDRLEGHLDEALPDYSFQLTRAGLISNSELQAAQIEIQRAQILTRRAEVQPVPNVTVQSGYMRQFVGQDHIGVLQLGLPLPLWNRNQGNIAAAHHGVTKAIESVRKTEVDLTKQLANATGRYEAARQRADKLDHLILPKARKSLVLVEKAYDVGEFDLLRVLQTQRAVVDSQLDLITAHESRWSAAAEIAGLVQEEVFPAPPAVSTPVETNEQPAKIVPQSHTVPAKKKAKPQPGDSMKHR